MYVLKGFIIVVSSVDTISKSWDNLWVLLFHTSNDKIISKTLKKFGAKGTCNCKGQKSELVFPLFLKAIQSYVIDLAF